MYTTLLHIVLNWYNLAKIYKHYFGNMVWVVQMGAWNTSKRMVMAPFENKILWQLLY